MATILYPTRAGDGTYRNLDRAAALAQERTADLILLYVSNVRFLDHFAGPVPLDLVEEELDELGQFLLVMAQEHAEQSGVKTETICMHGSFRQALVDVIRKHAVTGVVLGRPSHDTAVTTIDYISGIARSLADDLDVEAFVVHDGQVVEHYGEPVGGK